VFLISVPNVAFVITRLLLFVGRFHYGRAGILDKTHTRLFTLGSLRQMLKQTGFRLVRVRGVPAPFPKALRAQWLARLLLQLNRGLIWPFKRFFAYQFFAQATAKPSLPQLLDRTLSASERERRRLDHGV
jgi:hypothetical protein